MEGEGKETERDERWKGKERERVRGGEERETEGERGKETERGRNITWGWGGVVDGDRGAAESRSERRRSSSDGDLHI